VRGPGTARRWRIYGAGLLACALVALPAAGGGAATPACEIEPDAYCPGVDLSGKDLSDANLPGANFFDANLSDAKLADANLFNATLARTNLSGANVRRAVLARANLRRANLRHTNFTDANLRRADLLNADLGTTIFEGASFCHTTMPDGSERSDPKGCN
jgi:hypothetical protein